MISDFKKAIKHLIGKDLWIRPDHGIPTTFHGSVYGGWAIARDSLNEKSVVYSFGIGEDASFDESLMATYHCKVYAFDPTPKSLAWVNDHVRNPDFLLNPWALAAKDGEIELWLPDNPEHVSATVQRSGNHSQDSFRARCYSLASIMKQLGHDHLDVLKMDIEGSEYEVIQSLAAQNAFDSIGQLLVEFHHRMEGFGRDDTLNAIRLLQNSGYRIAWVSDVGHEVLFLKP